MRILTFPSDKYGCGQWRINLPGQAVAHQDPDVQVRVPLRFPGVVRNGRLVTLDSSAFEFDLVIIQRPTNRVQLEMISAFKRHGVAVVVEIDDLLSHVHQRSTAAKSTKAHHKRALFTAAALADLVTCSTPELARHYAKHGRVRVIENYVPAHWLNIRPEHAGNVVGWPGTVANHWTDLEATQGGVADAIRDTNATFKVIGRPELVQQKLRLDDPPEVAEWVEFPDYPHELAKLDVGIAPLNNSPFNRAKSWLKILEFSALGVPFVASDITEYRRFYEQAHIGTLATTRQQWCDAVTELVRNQDLREWEAQQGRQAVRDRFCLEDHAHRWADAWRTALDTRARNSGKKKSKTVLPDLLAA